MQGSSASYTSFSYQRHFSGSRRMLYLTTDVSGAPNIFAVMLLCTEKRALLTLRIGSFMIRGVSISGGSPKVSSFFSVHDSPTVPDAGFIRWIGEGPRRIASVFQLRWSTLRSRLPYRCLKFTRITDDGRFVVGNQQRTGDEHNKITGTAFSRNFPNGDKQITLSAKSCKAMSQSGWLDSFQDSL